ncbi:MAG TPA: PAS domain S-box protein, partial [Steroidobacteraceae bacterium]|nr:PAS domain S-box protein [Steroidobacteraceae bacterium]
ARSALDAAPDAMIIVDDAGVVRYANRQASVLFGYSHEQLIGRTLEQLMPARFRGRHVAHRRDYLEAPRVRAMGERLTLFGQRQDGSEFPVEISLSPVGDPERLLVAAAIRDVTDRKRAEAELRETRAAADQARQVADHLRAVADRARDNADRANQAKSRFLATASHDLRQPLQTLTLLNGILRRMITGGNATEALSQQEHAIEAMSRLLNALLDISKLESGAVRPEPADFPVGTLFAGLRGEFASIASSKGLELRVDPSGESVHSDPALVEQIMKNLVSNAVKYTRTGGVHLRCVRHDGAVRLDVIDTGIGIPPEQIAFIYDEFFQVGVPANTSRDGYGLGLSIVQRLVALLKARLEVRSDVGKGTVFSLLLPPGQGAGEPVAALSGAEPQSPQRAGGSPRILLVEDDVSVRDATRMLLRVEGYRVSAVSSLAEALQSAREEGMPDLLITDYHLRNRELGTEVIAALRRTLGRDVKAVLVTGDTSRAIKDLPGDPHLRVASKPVNTDKLLGLIKELLSV